MNMNTEAGILGLCDFVQTICGVALGADKQYLIDNRLRDILADVPDQSYDELVRMARDPAQAKLRTELINALTTNETLFFRDGTPFEAIRHKLLPELLDAQSDGKICGPVRIWSAACSTGQEAYSLAMIVRELLGESEWSRVTVLGTDVSDAAIQTASTGAFASHEIGRGLSDLMLNRHFDPCPDGWRIKDELRAIVTFRKANLLDSFDELGEFDIIMCRNVAIYFTVEDRIALFRRLRERMREGAALFVGSAESLLDMKGEFLAENHCRATLYRAS